MCVCNVACGRPGPDTGTTSEDTGQGGSVWESVLLSGAPGTCILVEEWRVWTGSFCDPTRDPAPKSTKTKPNLSSPGLR